ncbi:HDOD domain-containing protein [Frigoriglobus tundricola]|uniref:HDOD domain-containing protein n=1 Tax=Frigoriglobus tundricola TaxID=2774151 RepID=A0A6M5YIF7_9BACT|nr:HDOD domain-containing protein [Frigoriglobus tundricola]QJW92752.1 hypothetical protein FTUN_0249 [Frigoriglobus tundricola]
MFFKTFTSLFRGPPRLPIEPANLLKDLGKVETFPTLSDTTIRALELIHDPSSALAEVSDLVRRDAVLAVSLLKMANSIAYRGKHEIDDVRQAAVRLGKRGCLRVITSLGLKTVFRHRVAEARTACESLHRHALFTASLAAHLNILGDFGYQGEEFTAGLLHDIGRVIICVRVPEAFFRADPMSFREDATVLSQEREVLNIDHCEVGYRFAQANGLPDSVAATILNHHFPRAEEHHRDLVALVNLADALANHVQRERKLAGFKLEACPAYKILKKRLPPDVIDRFPAAVSGAVIKALRETRAMLHISAL